MTALTLQDVLAHQRHVRWPELYQIEQDLLLSLAMRAVFEDRFLAGQVAMRGGTTRQAPRPAHRRRSRPRS